MTFYELTEGGDLVHTTGACLSARYRSSSCNSCECARFTEFYRLPTPVLRKALDVLIKQGKAQVLKGTGAEDGGEGVKFV
jgi:ESCRT-II complex subunit VPS25